MGDGSKRGSNMYITLPEWDEKNFSVSHGIRTLRSWAKSGQIYPEPIKVGVMVMVEESAKFVPLPSDSDKIKAEVLADPVVNEIYNNEPKTA